MEIYSKARHLDLAVAKYGLFILIINVNAMTRREEGGRRQDKIAGVIAEYGSKSSFVKCELLMAYLRPHFILILRVCMQGIDTNYCLGKK